MPDDIIIPRKHYEPLIDAAKKLVTVSQNAAATVLEGGPYESMLIGPANALTAALSNVPGASIWDGVWRDADVTFEAFRHDAQPRNMPDIGVKAVHTPTGLSAESYVRHTVEANQEAARKGLKAIVERRGHETTA